MVYLATDRRHGREVALKALRAAFAASIGPERFLREIRIVAQLSHPNIVGLIDSGLVPATAQTPAIPWFVMPYIAGQSLRARLNREVQLPLEDAIGIAVDVSQALDYAHQHQVVHRDIKPENILLHEGRALVTDFGIARQEGAQRSGMTSSGGFAIGTPHYMSPEQWEADPHLDGRTDIYSLGCVLYEMLAGEPPFTGPTADAIRARHRGQAIPSVRVIRPSIPASVDRAIAGALAKVPADRFPSAAALREPLEHPAAFEPPPARWRLALPAAAALVVLGALGLLVWRGDRETPSPGPSATAIAVLPFGDASGQPAGPGLAAGLTDLVALRLDTVPGLQVRPRAVVAPLAQAPLDSIVRGTGAGTIVTGVVTAAGGGLGITVAVIDGGTLRQLGLRRWEQPAPQMLARSDSVADEVALFVRQAIGRFTMLRARLESGRKDVRALVLQARTLRDEASDDLEAGKTTDAIWRLNRSDSLLAQAERLDHRSTIATVERGWVAADRDLIVQTTAEARRDWIRRGLEFAERALAVAPRSADAYELRGRLRLSQAELDKESSDAAERDLVAALALDDSLAVAWSLLSRVYLLRGTFDSAAASARRALALDPYLRGTRATLSRLVNAELELEEYDNAHQHCEQGLRHYPTDPNFVECRLTVLAWSATRRAQVQDAWSELRRIEAGAGRPETEGYRRVLVAAVLARAGMPDSARALLRSAADYPFPNRLMEARVYALLGEVTPALDRLTTLVRDRPSYKPRLAAEPWFRPLRDDPRFQALIGR